MGVSGGLTPLLFIILPTVSSPPDFNLAPVPPSSLDIPDLSRGVTLGPLPRLESPSSVGWQAPSS